MISAASTLQKPPQFYSRRRLSLGGQLTHSALPPSFRSLLTCAATSLRFEPACSEELLPVLKLEEGGVYELGRIPPADLIVPVPTVSGRHCSVRVVKDGTVELTDLGSTNGTYIGDHELTPMTTVAVPIGSYVVFGDKDRAVYQLITVEEGEGGEGTRPADAASVSE